MKPLDQPHELRAYYQDTRIVSEYITRRTAQPLNGFLHRQQVAFLNQVVGERRPRRVLELAPGPARLTAELSFRGEGVLVDTSPAMLATARERLRSLGLGWNVVRGDAFALPFADHSFDFAYTLRFIRHFQVHDRRKVYAEIRRVLRPGGTFVLDAQNRAVSLPHRRRKGLDRYPIHDALYDRRELSEEIEEVGFRILKIEGILQHYGLQRRLNRLRRYGASSLARLAIETVEHLPGGNPSTWMILAEV